MEGIALDIGIWLSRILAILVILAVIKLIFISITGWDWVIEITVSLPSWFPKGHKKGDGTGGSSE